MKSSLKCKIYFRMRGGERMRKLKVEKMRLASLLLLTVLIPNIAYADEEIDESLEVETVTESMEAQNIKQTINEEETSRTDLNTYNNDIDTNTELNPENVGEHSAEDEGKVDILEPAEQPEAPPVVNTEGSRSNEETTQEDQTTEIPEGEEETPTGAVDDIEPETNNTLETPVIEEPENDGESNQQGDIEVEQEVAPELPMEQIGPTEPVEPQGEDSTGDFSTQENTLTEQPSESTVHENQETLTDNINDESAVGTEVVKEDQSAVRNEKKKLYRYDYGDILNGISFNEESIYDDLSTLDQRVSRVMSSKIIEEKDLTVQKKLELEEKVKAEQSSSYDREELPNTGEADSTHYAAAVLLTVFGAIFVFISRRLKTDN